VNDKDLTPFLDVRQNQLQLEVATGDAIDTKALGILASDFALLLFIAQSNGSMLSSFFTITTLLILSVAVVLTCIVVRPKNYAGSSTSMFDNPEYLDLKTEELIRQLLSDTEIALTTNEAINKSRWLMCAIALVLTLLTTVVLLLCIVIK